MISDLTLQPLTADADLLPLLSCRYCTQTLASIPNGRLRRTVNGKLVHTGLPYHSKYTTIIKGTDRLPPALENLWEGMEFRVGCISHLTQALHPELNLNRNPVAGSVWAEDAMGEPLRIQTITGRQVTLVDRTSAGYIHYRPLLNMCLMKFQTTTDEWGMTTGWQLELEET